MAVSGARVLTTQSGAPQRQGGPPSHVREAQEVRSQAGTLFAALAAEWMDHAAAWGGRAPLAVRCLQARSQPPPRSPRARSSPSPDRRESLLAPPRTATRACIGSKGSERPEPVAACGPSQVLRTLFRLLPSLERPELRMMELMTAFVRHVQARLGPPTLRPRETIPGTLPLLLSPVSSLRAPRRLLSRMARSRHRFL